MANSYLKSTLGGSKQNQCDPKRNDEVKNSSGMFVYSTGDLGQVRRFLILGSEGGTYYANETQLTQENAQNLMGTIKTKGREVVNLIRDISIQGLAPKNDPALFALAMCSAYGDDETRSYALSSLRYVARTGTHLFTFMSFVKNMRGFGRGMRSHLSHWYTEMPADKLAYQMVKYQNREGWSHGDIIKLIHPQAYQQVSEDHEALFLYAIKGWPNIGPDPHPNPNLQIVWATERAKNPNISETELLNLVKTYRLPMEAIPSAKQSKAIYEAVILSGPGLTWQIRNLGNLSKRELLVRGRYNEVRSTIINNLNNADYIQKARIHPIQILSATITYQQGHGMRSDNTWSVDPDIVAALENAFHLAFKAIEPSNRRFVLGIDVSGSMSLGSICGVQGLTPRHGAAAMSLITKVTEPYCAVMGFSNIFMDLELTQNDRLFSVMTKMTNMSFSSTNCSLPMQWAQKNKVEADVFVIYTDNETNHGHSDKPTVALEKYRQAMGINAKLVVVGMTATRFTIADPNDPRTMDVVGFDSSAPQVISSFAGDKF